MQTATPRVLSVIVQTPSLLLLLVFSGCSSEPERTYDVGIECRSPNGMRDTKILKRWKYEKVRDAIRKVLPTGDEGMSCSELKEQVTAEFSQQDQMLIGKMSWYIDTVILEMETAEELTRFPDSATPLPKNDRRIE